MAISMGKGCIEAIYGLMGWKGLRRFLKNHQISGDLLENQETLSLCTLLAFQLSNVYILGRKTGFQKEFKSFEGKLTRNIFLDLSIVGTTVTRAAIDKIFLYN